MQVWNELLAARCKYRMQKLRKNRHLRTIAHICRATSSQLRHVSTIGKKLLNSNISFIWLHDMVNVGLLTAEIGWRVLGTKNGRLLGWYTVCTFWGRSSPDGLLPGTKFSLRPSLALFDIGSISVRHSSSGRQPNLAALYLHATGRPSRSTLGGGTV